MNVDEVGGTPGETVNVLDNAFLDGLGNGLGVVVQLLDVVGEVVFHVGVDDGETFADFLRGQELVQVGTGLLERVVFLLVGGVATHVGGGQEDRGTGTDGGNGETCGVEVGGEGGTCRTDEALGVLSGALVNVEGAFAGRELEVHALLCGERDLHLVFVDVLDFHAGAITDAELGGTANFDGVALLGAVFLEFVLVVGADETAEKTVVHEAFHGLANNVAGNLGCGVGSSYGRHFVFSFLMVSRRIPSTRPLNTWLGPAFSKVRPSPVAADG